MTFTSILLSTALLAAAQQPGEPSTRSESAFGQSDGGGSAMAEHIEVLRQVLRHRLTRGAAGGWLGYSDPLAAAPMEGALTLAPDATANLGSSGLFLGTTVNNLRYNSLYAGEWGDSGIEGVYLPGYGVVFTATLPSAARGGKTGDEKPAAKPLSDWDRAQLELRGEKPQPVAQAEHRPPSLRDTILKVLADNGRHFSRLRDDERMTVVVTFRDGVRLTSTGAFAPFYGATTTTPKQPPLSMAGTVSQPAIAAPQHNQGARTPSSARDYELLADLHLRQQQYQAAAETYEKALAAYKRERGAGADDADDRHRLLTTRLAQSLLGQGQTDAAMSLLAKIKPGSGAKPSAPAQAAAQPKSRVPTKLVVTATKRQMDQVAQGRMTFEEFRKSATVEEE